MSECAPSPGTAEAIVAACPDAILVLDASGTIRQANEAAQRLFACSAEGLAGRPFVDAVLPARERVAYGKDFAREFEVGKGEFVGRRRELHLARVDGKLFPAVIGLVRIEASSPWFVCFVRDTTHASAMEAELVRSQRQLRELAGRIEAAREEERTHIARELHDELGQQLTGLHMELTWLLRRVRRGAEPDPEVVARLEEAVALAEATTGVARRITTELRPRILDDLGLADAIRWQAREFERRSGLRVAVHATAGGGPSPPSLATAAFRSFQELLTNVGRHARARRVVVRLREEPGELLLRVSDDGRGIREEEAAGLASFGLVGIRERAALLGGSFHVEGLPERGTVATLTLPIREAEPS